jgi:GNAT superfamily N-acetyltransferase
MIFIKKCDLLSHKEREQISALILSCFENSRLSTYDTVIWYEENNNVIAFMGYHINYHHDAKNNDITILNQLCVRKEYRHKGIATELLKYTEELIKTTIILYIDKHEDDTDILYEFYEKRGYQDIDILDKEFAQRCNARYFPEIEYLMIKLPITI